MAGLDPGIHVFLANSSTWMAGTSPAMTMESDEAERTAWMGLLPDHRRTMVRHGDVEHAQLHPLDALVAVDREGAGDMQDLAAMRKQGIAELLADRAERDGVHHGAVAGLEAQLQMRLPDLVGIDQLMRRQRDDRLGIAAAERAGAVERRNQFGRGGPRADRAVDQQLVDVPRLGYIGGERAFEIGAEFAQPLLAQGDAGGH